MKNCYRALLPIIICAVLPLSLLAQNPIPNPGFEDWSGIDPDSWTTTNLQGQVTNVTQTSDAHSGSSAARGEVVDLFVFPFAPGLMTGFTGPCCLPFPISQDYESMTGYYKCGVEGMDIGLTVLANFLDADMQPVAIGIDIFGQASSFQQFTVLMDYSQGNGNDAAFAQIELTIASDDPDSNSRGSWFIVDDLAFEGTTGGIDEIGHGSIPKSFELRQNYPNPFNPSTTIDFSVPDEGKGITTLHIYDLRGRLVRTLIDEELSPGNFSLHWDGKTDLGEKVSSGTYLYRLEVGDFTTTKKMILVE